MSARNKKLLAKATAFCDASPPLRALRRAWRALPHRRCGRFAKVLHNAVKTGVVHPEMLERLVPNPYLPRKAPIDFHDWMRQHHHPSGR